MTNPDFTFHKDLAAIIAERDRLKSDNEDRAENERVLREFYNGRPTKTEEQVAETGEDVTNHLFGHARIHAAETAFRSVFTGKSTFIEVTVDTNQQDKDFHAGILITQMLNRAIQHRPDLFNLIQSVSGELPISGRAALMFSGLCNWIPRLSRGLLLPEDTPPNPCKISYAYAPRKLTYAQLVKMSEKKGNFVNTDVVKAIIEGLTDKDKDGTSKTNLVRHAYGADRDDLSTDQERGTAKIKETVGVDAWEYFEVKHGKDGYQVSSTIWAEGVSNYVKQEDGLKDDEKLDAVILSHDPKAYASPEEWVVMLLMDSELGGVKTWDSARGIAELCYPNDAEVEVMVNAMVDGAIMRARPRFQSENGRIDELRKWDFRESLTVPEGTKEFKLSGDSGEMAQNIGMLTQNAASLASSSTSNSAQGGELRVQALQRGAQNTSATLSRLDCFYRYLQPFVEQIVNLFFNAKIKPGWDGYEDIAWFRYQLKLAGIGEEQLKLLGKRLYGRFNYLRVKVVRSLGEGDAGSRREVAEMLMKNLASFAPQVRPIILQLWTSLVSNDQDFAERLVSLPNLITSSGRVTAENERDTIYWRAAAGQTLPTGADDVDQDHAESHIIDMQAAIARNSIQPWTRIDALGFAGLATHTAQHVQNMQATAGSKADGNAYAALLQQTVQEAQPIIDALEEAAQQQQQQGGGLEATESAALAVKRQELLLKARELGLKERQQDALELERTRNFDLKSRGQFTKELTDKEKLALEQKKIDKKPASSSK